jgi:acetolactate synthase I/II/III large subunit
MTPGTDFILSALIQEGLDHLFMVPGGLVDPFLPALGRAPKLRAIVAAQEGGAAYMADGYARASGRFGAALGIGGPGLCNMTTAVAAAKTDASPVLVLSGEVAVALEGLGAFQDASQATLDDTAVMKPLTRLSITVADARNLDHWLRHALTAMWSIPSGPVHLSLTQDVLTGQCTANYSPIADYFPQMMPLSRDAALTTLAHLAGGGAPRARIAFLVGAGVEHDQAAARLRDIAERWSIPVATTLRAKGALPEDHDLSLGVFGYAGTRHATAAVLDEALDVLIVLGSGLNERDSMHWTLRQRSKAMLLQVNTDMDELTAHGDAGRMVLGSGHAFLDLMAERADVIAATLEKDQAQRRAWIDKIKSGPRLYDAENCASRAVPIHPATAISALRHVFPRDGLMLVDSGAHRAFAGQSRTDGLGDRGGGRGPMCAARPPGRGPHRRRLHANARDGNSDSRPLRPADHLRRAQQRRTGQRLAARPHRGAGAGGTDQHSGPRLGQLRAFARRARLHRARSGRARGYLPQGARGQQYRGDRCQNRQELPDTGL